jgi:hypothetical protein
LTKPMLRATGSMKGCVGYTVKGEVEDSIFKIQGQGKRIPQTPPLNLEY